MIDNAARYVPPEQLALSLQCGIASSGRGNPLTQEQRWRLPPSPKPFGSTDRATERHAVLARTSHSPAMTSTLCLSKSLLVFSWTHRPVCRGSEGNCLHHRMLYPLGLGS